MEILPTLDASTPATPVRPRQVILLAGQVRPTPLIAAIGRSLLDLPVSADRRIIDLWSRDLAALHTDMGLDRLEVRVVVDQATPPPQFAGGTSPNLRLERDPTPLRGTGGLLRDLALDLDEGASLLVAHGPQILFQPLPHLTALLLEAEADVAILAQNCEPCGLMLIRCGVLHGIPEMGFVDLREQALPQIARDHSVKTVPLGTRVAMPTRTREDYIHALRLHALRKKGLDLDACDHPFAESWETAFAIIEPGADVHHSARIHDSVILAGARVGRDAVVAYSLVGPAGIVAPRATVLGAVVGGGRLHPERT